MKIQVLTTAGCAHGARALALVTDVVRQHAPGTEVDVITIATVDEAARWSFPGSPTIRVDGVDVEPDAPQNASLG